MEAAPFHGPFGHRQLLLVAFLTAAAAVPPAGDGEDAAALLAGDDQCSALGDEACALNALQARALKKKFGAAGVGAAHSAGAAAGAGASTGAAGVNGSAALSEPSCQAYGCQGFSRRRPCQCNSKCAAYHNCCADYVAVCQQGPSHSPGTSASAGCYKSGLKYSLSWKAEGIGFFDNWTFVTEDMVHGAHQFTTREDAERYGLISADGTSARIGVGGLRQPSRPGEAYKRYSVHIRSNEAWEPQKSMVVAMKYRNVPNGCGIWPGFWTTNSDKVWPNGGELDILEYANYDESKVSFHTSVHCHLDSRRIAQCLPKHSKGPGPNDCFTSYFKNAFGCRPRQHQRRGDEYAKNPGVVAAEWTEDHITVFYFPEGQIPLDLANNTPQPDGWSDFVEAFLPFKQPCSGIGPQELVLNVQLCGDAAGGPWAGSACARQTMMQSMLGQCHGGLSEPSDCCTQYVTSPLQDEALQEHAFFDVTYVKVFTPDGAPGQLSGTFKRGGELLK